MPERLFTPADADALLDTLRPLLEQARALAGELVEGRTSRSLQTMSGGNGGGASARTVVAAGERLGRLLKKVEGFGVIVKDPRTGLVDFPALRGNAEVYLCWRLGEESLGWWHPRDTGFAGRRRIDW